MTNGIEGEDVPVNLAWLAAVSSAGSRLHYISHTHIYIHTRMLTSTSWGKSARKVLFYVTIMTVFGISQTYDVKWFLVHNAFLYTNSNAYSYAPIIHNIVHEFECLFLCSYYTQHYIRIRMPILMLLSYTTLYTNSNAYSYAPIIHNTTYDSECLFLCSYYAQHYIRLRMPILMLLLCTTGGH